MHHAPTETVSLAERRVMRELGGSCNLPLGVFGEITGDSLTLSVFLADPQGNRRIEVSLSGSAMDPLGLADRLVELVWQRGGRDIVAAIAAL